MDHNDRLFDDLERDLNRNGPKKPISDDPDVIDVQATPVATDKIVKDTDHSVPTIENALQFVSKPGTQSVDSWQAKGLGLQMVLLGLAEVQALRISRLAGLVFHLEQKVFDPKVVETLEPHQLVHLYNSAVRALDGSTNYVRDIVKNVNWKDLEEKLMSAYAADRANQPRELKSVSQAMLNILARSKDLVPDVNMDFD